MAGGFQNVSGRFASVSDNSVKTARSSRFCATFIFASEKTALSLWTPGWSIPHQSGPPEQPAALEKGGSQERNTIVSAEAGAC